MRKNRNLPALLALLLCFSACKKQPVPQAESAGEPKPLPAANVQAVGAVRISGNKFYVNGKQIFFNGINTAWQKQSDYSLDFLDRNYDPNW